MVVTRAGAAQCGSPGVLAQGVLHRRGRGQRAEGFDEPGDGGPGEAVVAVAAVGLDGQEPGGR